MHEPSWFSTASYWEKIAMPGPMAAWARSTGAMGEAPSEPPIIASSASGISRRNWRWNSLRAIDSDSSGRLRQTRTTEEARALVPFARILPEPSVRTGHVPSIRQAISPINSSIPSAGWQLLRRTGSSLDMAA
ncbi:hypothetical protein [Thiolapillus sp.]|uniref:hypothetical protein n=1 Tax=Thiolapillus sp. TaxID=2017437 RepID=UPI003AF5589C